MSAQNLDVILDRATKLRALSGSSNVNEATLAAEKLQALLFRYNLELADVDRAHGTTIGIGRDDVDLGRGGGRFFRANLLGTIARYNFCRAIWLAGENTSALLGQPHNVEVVKHLYTYLHSELVRYCERDLREQSVPPSARRNWREGFWVAAIATINDRLSAMQAQQEAEHIGSTALVTDMAEQISRALSDLMPDSTIRSTTRKRTLDAEGYASGERAGNAVNFHRPIGGSDSDPRALVD